MSGYRVAMYENGRCVGYLTYCKSWMATTNSVGQIFRQKESAYNRALKAERVIDSIISRMWTHLRGTKRNLKNPNCGWLRYDELQSTQFEIEKVR